MATRRLRLFVVAYLRGVLDPYYKNGISSQIRERLVLDAIASDLDSKSLENSIAVDIGLLSAIKGENLSGHYDRIYDKIYKIRALKEHDYIFDTKLPDSKKEKVTVTKHSAQTAEQLATVYNILEKSGLLAKIAVSKLNTK